MPRTLGLRSAFVASAFHCHILINAKGPDGMFGMVAAVAVEER